MAGKQGFASMDDDKQKDIASQGGQASDTGGNTTSQSSSTSSRSTGTNKQGSNLTDADRAKGGRNSNGGGNS